MARERRGLRGRTEGNDSQKRWIVLLIVLVGILTTALVVISIYFGIHHQCHRNPKAPSVGRPGVPATDLDGPDNHHRHPEDIRLPRSLLPVHYVVRLLPWMDEGNFTTDGYVRIVMRCAENTSRIVLHSADNRIHHQSVKMMLNDPDKREVMVERVEEDPERQFLLIHLTEELVQGSYYSLSIKFIGLLGDQQRGFFRMAYQEDGIKKYVAVTQMEPVDARRAFPCFDEPSFKAEFSIILGRKSHMTALSNMPKKLTIPVEGVPGYEWDHFHRSVPMSSYLVAMSIVDFSFVERDVGGIKFRLWARHSAINQTKYGLDMSVKMLQFFAEYFDVDYKLPKQDMLALPDFPGAMENWGLITYGEQHLLYDPDVPSHSHRELVAQVIAHEQAHQWFGNLVTMDWWNDLWLNEGFASFLSYVGADHFEPGYHLGQQFVLNELQAVMGVDGLASSHPISQPVHHPDEIGQIFDRISYNKGATVIRMLAEFLGHVTLQRGLSRYLKSRMYGNAVQDDLWASLTQQARMDSVQLPADIKSIMDSWTLKMGYPVVTINRHYSASTIVAHQERFLLDARSPLSDHKKRPYLWWVPLTYTWRNNKRIRSGWIPEESDQVVIPFSEAKEDEWVLFNVDQVGYYRVNYDKRNWDLIAEQLLSDAGQIPVINRAQLIDDAFNLARSGRLDYSVALNLTRYLGGEVEYLPWKAVSTALKFLDAMLGRTPIYGAFQDYVLKLVDGLFQHVNVPQQTGDDPLRAYTRNVAWRLACHFQHRDCLREAVQLYANWMEHPEKPFVPAYLRSAIACTAVAHGGKKEWDFARLKFASSNHANEKEDLLEAMCCASQPWIISRMLGWTLDGTLSKSDSINLFTHLVRHPLGRYMTFDFFQAYWDVIQNNFRMGTGAFAGLLDIATESFNTPMELEQLRQFFSEKPKGRAYDQVIERVEVSVLWMNRNKASISEWLRQQEFSS